MKPLKYLFFVLFLALTGLCAFSLVYPDVAKLAKEVPKKTAMMEYREKEWKSKGKTIRIRKRWVPLSAVSPYLVKAVIIAEDDKFWSHKGFDVDAIQKALEKDIKVGKLKFGGSTISQQLVKNLYLSPSKNPVRKFQEAIITWRLERALSKRRIIELYLNVAEWGEGIFGIEEASRHYYGKPAIALGPEEASNLAVVLPNPRKYRADGNSRYVQRRANVIYNVMVRRGIVVPEFDTVMEEERQVSKESPGATIGGPIEEASKDQPAPPHDDR
jgi:monofunctional biosynthetic peptidoglycan transglycosylase